MRTAGATPQTGGASFSDLLAAAGRAAPTRFAGSVPATAAVAGPADGPATPDNAHACCASNGAAKA